MYASILFFNFFFILVKCHLHVGEYQKINTYSDYFSGVCKCSRSYIGMDCSHAKSIPPINFSLPENGVCKTSQRACTKTNIFGHFHSENVMAKLEEFRVMKFLRIFLKILSFILSWFILQKLFSNSIRKLFKNIIKNVTFRNERKLLKIYTHQVFGIHKTMFSWAFIVCRLCDFMFYLDIKFMNKESLSAKTISEFWQTVSP